MRTRSKTSLSDRNAADAREIWPKLNSRSLDALRSYSESLGLSVSSGDLMLLNGSWYATHSGLLRLARKKNCIGIDSQPVVSFCEPAMSRWAFKATVYTSHSCKGFVGYGDADPSNVSRLVRGAEMRVAETRAVNRALRKAYGIGICSVEELGSAPEVGSGSKIPPQPANGSGYRSHPKLRDRLLQLVRQHQLDPVLVRAYAIEFCGSKTLREATREQVENFIHHLADWAEKDKNALLCQLNSYLRAEPDSNRGAA